MFTDDVVTLLILASVPLAGAVYLLVYGIYIALTDHDMGLCAITIVGFLCLSTLSGVGFNEAHKEYKNAIPENQIKILKQKISDAEKEYQKYLIDHPNLKAKENYTK